MCLTATTTVQAQEVHAEFCVDFRVNSIIVDSAFHDNGLRIAEMLSAIEEMNSDSLLVLQEVMFCGSASPEGPIALNKRLATKRMKTLEQIVRLQFSIPDSIVTYDDRYIPWDYLEKEVKASDFKHKDEVLQILDNEELVSGYHHSSDHHDHRIELIKAIDGGSVWRELNERYFKRMRNACVVLFYYKRVPVASAEKVLVDTT